VNKERSFRNAITLYSLSVYTCYGLSLQKYYYSHEIKFLVTLQQKQQKRNTTMYSKRKLSFIPKTFQGKQSLVLLSKNS